MTVSLSSVSIIVPTFREALNLETLVQRVFSTLAEAEIEGELIIVDDNSQDGTIEVVETLQKRYSVRLIVRERDRGLSSAVVEGLKSAKHGQLVVMDADLQHPPEMIPALLAALDQDGCDFVLGTRYGRGGSIVEGWSIWRRLASRLATMLAKPLAPMSDPMSGFFALTRGAWERASRIVDPIGYKIGLELFVKSRCGQHAEVPIRFEVRKAGQSKFSVAEQLRYGRHLIKLYRFRFPALFVCVCTLVLAGGILAVYTKMKP